MKLMGLDVGEKTIGIAVSDALNITAQGVMTLRRTEEEEDIQKIRKLIEEYEIEKLVVGLPKNMNGTIGFVGERVLLFAERLKEALDIPVDLWDERLTTMEAERVLLQNDISRKKRKKVIDKLAAVLILQNYMDRFSNKEGF